MTSLTQAQVEERVLPLVQRIFQEPGVDLETISSKKVRKRLVELGVAGVGVDGNEWVKEHKDAINEVIRKVFATVSGDMDGEGGGEGEGEGEGEGGWELPASSQVETGGEGSATSNGQPSLKRKRTETGQDTPTKTPGSTAIPSSSQQSSTDAELARRLQKELNTTSYKTRHGSASSSSRTKKSSRKSVVASGLSAASTPNGKRGNRVKSKATIEDSDAELDHAENNDADSESEMEVSEDSAPPKKRAKKRNDTGEDGPRKARGGFAKEWNLSEPLAHVVEAKAMARTQVVKKLWEYIRYHNLQNPANRKVILCDDKLQAVFGKQKVDMFEMNKLLSKHLYAQ